MDFIVIMGLFIRSHKPTLQPNTDSVASGAHLDDSHRLTITGDTHHFSQSLTSTRRQHQPSRQSFPSYAHLQRSLGSSFSHSAAGFSLPSNLPTMQVLPNVPEGLLEYGDSSREDEAVQVAPRGGPAARQPLAGVSQGQRVPRQGHMYPCRNCGKVFGYVHSMTRHRRKCEGAYHLSCEICGLMFHRRDRYNTHLQLKHGVTAPAGVRGLSYGARIRQDDLVAPVGSFESHMKQSPSQ